MTASWFLWQEVVGVEHVWVGERLLVPVDFERADDDRGTDRQRDIVGRWKEKKQSISDLAKHTVDPIKRYERSSNSIDSSSTYVHRLKQVGK